MSIGHKVVGLQLLFFGKWPVGVQGGGGGGTPPFTSRFLSSGLSEASAEPSTDDEEDDGEIVMPAGRDTTSMTYLDIRACGLRMAQATFGQSSVNGQH